jgi:hypothetical protein
MWPERMSIKGSVCWERGLVTYWTLDFMLWGQRSGIIGFTSFWFSVTAMRVLARVEAGYCSSHVRDNGGVS